MKKNKIMTAINAEGLVKTLAKVIYGWYKVVRPNKKKLLLLSSYNNNHSFRSEN